MSSRFGVLIAVFVMVSAVMLPMADADQDDPSEEKEKVMFTYRSLLDDNAAAVYDYMAKEGSSVEGTDRTFTVGFSDAYFDDEEKAKDYADKTVQNALAADYYSNPMIPYLWDYPVTDVEVTADLHLVAVTDGEETVNKWAVKAVSFTLSLPEGVTEESVQELEELISEIKITGSTEASKVRSINSYLSGVSTAVDEEGEVSNIYDALITKKSSSAGIAAAFTHLCNANGVKSIVVSGPSYASGEEEKSYWNYVYLEGENGFEWFIVDSAYCNSAGIAGTLTDYAVSSNTYQMGSLHVEDLDMENPNCLKAPVISQGKYIPPEGEPFFDKYGGMILIAIVGAVIVAALLYAVKTGQY